MAVGLSAVVVTAKYGFGVVDFEDSLMADYYLERYRGEGQEGQWYWFRGSADVSLMVVVMVLRGW